MSFVADVLTVLIASPSDVARERETATQEIHRWNAAHGRARQLFLSPVRWETHSSPQMGAPPQIVLDKQILEDADIVIGIFWTRIGTPTPDYPSGTVEEINKHVAAGKLAMVYFSNAPVPLNTVDQEQWKAVQAFKTECHDKGLFHEFETEEQFRHDFSHHLNIELNKPEYASLERPPGTASRESAEPVLSDDERELLIAIGTDPHGSALHGRTLEGSFVQANGVGYGDGTQRTAANLQQVLKRRESWTTSWR